MEDDETLTREIEGDKNKCNHVLCSWIGRVNIIKMSTLSKAIYRSDAISIKIPMADFTKLEKNSKNLYIRKDPK